ncbi:MAG: MFS transporter, partial [Lentisphaeria bacterium]|nr:MFS transporter [Lentisphaeria bacterium]
MDISKRIAWSDWNMLIFITLIYFFANMQKVLVPGATFDEIQQLFDVDASAVSNTGAIFLCVYAISQLAVGVMADRFGGAKVIVWGGLIFCIGSVLSGVPGSFMLLCVSRFLTGLGAAAIYLSMIKEIARISGSALPLFLGIAMIVGYSGAIAGASPFIAGVKHLGYSKMMLITGGVTAAVYAGFLLSALKNQFPAVRKEVTFSISSYLNVFKRRHNIALLAVCG